MNNDKKTKEAALIVCSIALFIVFAIAYNFLSDSNLFESKSDKCKYEAEERSVILRDSKLKELKLMENPTQENLEEIERLERKQEVGFISRDDYDYFYMDCMR